MVKKRKVYTNKIRTVCEVIRECQDCVYDINYESKDNKNLNKKSNQIAKKLIEIHDMVKRMNAKLIEYKEGYDDGWYDYNYNYYKSKKKRKLRPKDE